MENLHLILSVIGTILGFIAVLATFVIKLIRLVKENKSVGQSAKLCDMLLPLIEEAEKLTDLDGEQKKLYVIDKIEKFALSNAFGFFDMELISKKIDEIVSLTKSVNIK